MGVVFLQMYFMSKTGFFPRQSFTSGSYDIAFKGITQAELNYFQ